MTDDMKPIVSALALALVLSGCAGGDRAHIAGEVGEAMAAEILPALTLAARGGEGTDQMIRDALDAAIENAESVDGVGRIVDHGLSSGLGAGRADVAVRLVVVPDESELLFCMDFAMASTGEMIAREVPGDPLTYCDNVETAQIPIR